ncbi:hypothetical protein OHA25_15340 [Nonomuraea sp. NBC_00507]|uniref:hypothetical protein n=1 Tax=Nonomuraea sp. NBC_00507 TaxID=2976002 RepID=UPI002E195F00
MKKPELQVTLNNKLKELEHAHELKKDEISASVRAELEAEQERRKEDRSEQVRRQVVALAGPMLGSVRDLIARLDNILEHSGHGPLHQDWDERKPSAWSNTHDYFMSSTLYVFGRYFAWVQVLRARLGPDEYVPQPDKDALLDCVQSAANALSSFPAPYNKSGCLDRDTQVFSWQQAAMGEVLIRQGPDQASVCGYSNFLDERDRISVHFEPLRALLLDLGPHPDGNCRWLRLVSARDGLITVRDECKRILEV